jgi:hypothetical protein
MSPESKSEHSVYANSLLVEAGVLLLGRATYEGLSAAYTAMSPNAFVDRIIAIPKYVASRTLRDVGWNATIIKGDVASFVTDQKQEAGGTILGQASLRGDRRRTATPADRSQAIREGRFCA